MILELLQLGEDDYLQQLGTFIPQPEECDALLKVLSAQMANQPSARCVQLASVVLAMALPLAFQDPGLWQSCSAFLDGCHQMLKGQDLPIDLRLSLVGLMGAALRWLAGSARMVESDATWWDAASVQSWLEGVLGQLNSLLWYEPWSV